MRVTALVIGILLLVAGGLIAAGVIEFNTREQVADIGPIQISKTEERRPTPTLGWVLLGLGAVATVVGLVAKR